MNYLKLCISTLLFLNVFSHTQAQIYQGYNTSNFAGINGIYENPANLGDSRYILDLNLAGLEFNFNNNYITFNTGVLSIDDNPILDSIYNKESKQYD